MTIPLNSVESFPHQIGRDDDYDYNYNVVDDDDDRDHHDEDYNSVDD